MLQAVSFSVDQPFEGSPCLLQVAGGDPPWGPMDSLRSQTSSAVALLSEVAGSSLQATSPGEVLGW